MITKDQMDNDVAILRMGAELSKVLSPTVAEHIENVANASENLFSLFPNGMSDELWKALNALSKAGRAMEVEMRKVEEEWAKGAG